MDRTIVYPGSIPLDSDILAVNRDAMIAIGYLAQASLGIGVVADGLACTPTSPTSMSIVIGPGTLTSFGPVDSLGYGSLGTDTNESIVKMGINHAPTTFTLAAPSGQDQAINYLIEASFIENDTSPAVLTYYNAANPAQPYTGPNNAGTAQNTQRVQQVQLRLVSGAPGVTNLQVTPTPDAGWYGLYVITVLNTMTSIGGGTISVYPLAPFLPFKLPQLTPGHSSMAVFNTTQTWVAPFGTRLVKLRMVGGGGGGGAGGGGGGGGGAAGGWVEGYYTVTPGTPVICTVGAGGISGNAGGASSFGAYAVASGGAAGAAGGADAGGPGAANGGTGSGTGILIVGGPGQSGFASSSLLFSGAGGASVLGAGGTSVMANAGTNLVGASALAPGGGGAGGVGGGGGGGGAGGLIVLEW